ncbi:MAG: hypothetical protein QOH50_1095, partial [Kribbellaceae bacterium]|nr:hypothetical protein [Kribbellaceae bacterium]
PGVGFGGPGRPGVGFGGPGRPWRWIRVTRQTLALDSGERLGVDRLDTANEQSVLDRGNRSRHAPPPRCALTDGSRHAPPRRAIARQDRDPPAPYPPNPGSRRRRRPRRKAAGTPHMRHQQPLALHELDLPDHSPPDPSRLRHKSQRSAPRSAPRSPPSGSCSSTAQKPRQATGELTFRRTQAPTEESEAPVKVRAAPRTLKPLFHLSRRRRMCRQLLRVRRPS